MQSIQDLSALSDDDLLHQLAALLDDSRRTEADLVAHIAEVDARRLYAREATPSMFQYCTERLHLSGAGAYLRIAAGRAARAHPIILAMLADGRLHLTAIALLAPHLTPENRDVLLQRATHKTKREIEELPAEIAPRPDALAMIRKLPERWTTRATGPASRAFTGPSAALTPSRQPGSTPGVIDQEISADLGLRPDGVASRCLDQLASPARGTVSAVESRPEANASIQPLSAARCRIQFTASAELRDKLERLRALMRFSAPDGDLAAIIDAAVTEKLERLDARRFGRTRQPRKAVSDSDTRPRTRSVPAAVKRTVDARDEGRCAYVDDRGRRCTARVGLQFHHRHTFATGGDHSPANVSLLCSGHNRYLAEIDYGREALAAHARRSAQASGRSSAAPPNLRAAGP